MTSVWYFNRSIIDYFADAEDVPDFAENYDLENIHTPINCPLLIKSLWQANYDPHEISFQEKGFTSGFDICYRGPKNRQSRSNNIPLKLGNKVQLWNKIMKEVWLKRVAGPFNEIPFKNFIQSPIGLVPKSGNQTRLIFHLSYDFGVNEQLLNHHTPAELCSVTYQDIDSAVWTCLRVKSFKLKNWILFLCKDHKGNQYIYLGKLDIKSAFCLVPLSQDSWPWLVMKARNPETGEWQYFIDKCLPFGSSISWSHFQRFSDALKHLLQYHTAMDSINNYLDNFLFLAATLLLCNYLIQESLDMCEELGVPIALDKTEWATLKIAFLGILLNGQNMSLVMPEEKWLRAVNMIQLLLDRSKGKATVKEIQMLCGYLNFLNKAIVPGRAFTRHMYAKFSKIMDISMAGLPKQVNKFKSSKKLKPYHHVKMDWEFRLDCKIWLQFLTDRDLRMVVNHLMINLGSNSVSEPIIFYSDASKAPELGFRCYMNDKWIFDKWPKQFIQTCDPSIEFLELYALVAGMLTWETYIKNARVTVFCDNKAAIQMVNKTTSSCPQCMKLIRILVLNCLKFNRWVKVKFVSTKVNGIADALSQLQFKCFRRLAPGMQSEPDQINSFIDPITKIWFM